MDERAALVRLMKRVRVNRAVAFRARIVLACIDESDTAVARLRTTKTTVAKWRSQFVAHRLAGLYDEPRVGAPRTISDAQVEAIIVKTLETTPAGETHWSTRSMAKVAGVSHTTIGRIWRTFRLQPHCTESFKISPDPQRSSDTSPVGTGVARIGVPAECAEMRVPSCSHYEYQSPGKKPW